MLTDRLYEHVKEMSPEKMQHIYFYYTTNLQQGEVFVSYYANVDC